MIVAPPRATAPSTARIVLDDCVTMTGRCLRLLARTPDAFVVAVAVPALVMLAFIYVFGGAIGLAVDVRYVDYVVPGVLVLCVGHAAAWTAVAVTHDLESGIVDRFRSLPTAAGTLLVGHAVTSLVRNSIATVAVVGVAVAAGFRPTAGWKEWLAAAGLIALFALAVTWLAICAGLVVRSLDAAAGFGFVMLFVPYLSSAFVPSETMHASLRSIADHQPMTPLIDSLRWLVSGVPASTSAWAAVAWWLPIAAVSIAAAPALYRRRTTD